MPRINKADIIVELVELGQEVVGEVRQQLTYYRASVYKDETAGAITRRVENLRMLTGLIGDDTLVEAMKDFDAMKEKAHLHYIPGECSLSMRVSKLSETLDRRFNDLLNTYDNNGYQIDQQLNKRIVRHRRELMALCRHGSRHRMFFQSF